MIETRKERRGGRESGGESRQNDEGRGRGRGGYQKQKKYESDNEQNEESYYLE